MVQLRIQKREGQIVNFDKTKIYNAVLKAMQNGSGIVKKNIAQAIADEIEEELTEAGRDIVKISEIETLVFNKLISKKQKLTARAYEGYRSVREFQREHNTIDTSIEGLVDGSNQFILSENSNKNEFLISTVRDLVAEEVSKDYAKRKMLTPDVVTGINEGIIYVHDLGHYMNKSCNCLPNYTWVDTKKNGKAGRSTLKDVCEYFEVVPTEDGTTKEIHEKYYIRDNKGWTRLKAIMARKVKPGEKVYKFKTSDGRSLECTGGHRVPVLRGNKPFLVEAKNIVLSDKLFYVNDTYIVSIDKALCSELDSYKLAKKALKKENVSTEGFEKLPTTDIVSIDFVDDVDVVVDLQTESNYYVANDYLVHNCCLVNLKDMLDNGTSINGKLIESPHKFTTACTITTQIVAQVASGQFGGQTITLSHLAPYLRKSKIKIENSLRKQLDGVVDDKTIERLVKDRLQEELTSGVQTFNYQCNTLQTSNGQSPFLSVFMYVEEDPEYEEETAMIIEEFLKQRLQGMKNEVGAWITPAFPKLLYVSTPNNIYEGSKYYYLTELAAKCIAKRMMPDMVSEKQMKLHYEGNVFPCMGCRAWLSPYTGGTNNIEGQYKWYGRFNMGVTSINLPDCGLSAHGDMDEFWRIFDERLDLCKKSLLLRYDNLKDVKSDVSPIHFQFGAIARLSKGAPIAPLLKDGYATISLGYIGVAECVRALIGESNISKKGEELALKIVQHMKDKVLEWKKETGLGFALYGTPSESLTEKFARSCRKRFGVIKDITDHDYLTNSFHCTVREEIDPFKKLEYESKFHAISSGGCISYIEMSNMNDNIPVVIQMMQYMYENIQYAEFNTKSDYCHVCGFDGEIVSHRDDATGEWIWECPNCHNTDKTKMNVTRRTCGYLGENFWNAGRTEEIHDRYVHLDNHYCDC